MKSFKPLLASPADLSLIDYRQSSLSPKLDGIRALVIGGQVLSRKLLKIPNLHVQTLFGRPEYEGLDVELIVGPPNSPSVYNDTYRGVMKGEGEPDVRAYVLDHFGNPHLEFADRYDHARKIVEVAKHPMTLVYQHHLEDEAHLLRLEETYLAEGYEGVMVRLMYGPRSSYKFGRSTAKEGTLLKLKRFVDDEARVVGFEEEMKNNNEATTDELGRTKRSTHQENKVGKGRLGALVCETVHGVRFNIGTGFDAKQREDFWADREKLIGRYAKFKHFTVGAVEAPRFPVFLGWRDSIDM